MQARYYDPVIGRFYSNDPVGFSAKEPMLFNRYSYANNNPYKFTDPDGRAVKVAPNVQKEYSAAKSYISAKSSVGKAYFDKLESKNTPTVEVNRTSGGSDSQVGDPAGPDVINWNPNEGLVTSDGSQSPATGLVHEVIHVQNSQSGITDKATDDNQTIMKENVVNGQTGEGTRRDHNDGAVREVSGPTCRPTSNGESCG